MALNSNALTTVANVKEFLEISESTYDSLFESLINQLSTFIENQTNQKLAQQAIANEVYDGGDEYLVLKSSPVSDVSSVQYNAGDQATPNWVDYSENSYCIKESSGMIVFFGGSICGCQNLRVTYNAGYASGELPDDLVMLANKLVSRLFDRRKSQGKTSESIEGASINWMSNFDEFDKAILANYRDN